MRLWDWNFVMILKLKHSPNIGANVWLRCWSQIVVNFFRLKFGRDFEPELKLWYQLRTRSHFDEKIQPLGRLCLWQCFIHVIVQRLPSTPKILVKTGCDNNPLWVISLCLSLVFVRLLPFCPSLLYPGVSKCPPTPPCPLHCVGVIIFYQQNISF